MPSGQPLVVVVEDDVDMNRALESVLNAAGFRAAMYSSAEALLEARAPADTACLVLDVHLPGIGGFELYERLAGSSAIPVVFMTAYDDPATRAGSEKVGASGYLTKPFAGKKLVELVRRVIRHGHG